MTWAKRLWISCDFGNVECDAEFLTEGRDAVVEVLRHAAQTEGWSFTRDGRHLCPHHSRKRGKERSSGG